MNWIIQKGKVYIMYNLTNELKELDLLIESTKEEFNDYAESLLSEHAFNDVKPLLESAHFEAELIVTEAEDDQANKIKEAGDEAKDKVNEKFNSPAYVNKCKEIEDAIKADPSVGEELVEVPAVDKICKEIISSTKKGEEIDKAILSQTETITLKQLMLKRKRIQTIIGVTIGAVATVGSVLVLMSIDNKLSDRESDFKEKLFNKIDKNEFERNTALHDSVSPYNSSEGRKKAYDKYLRYNQRNTRLRDKYNKVSGKINKAIGNTRRIGAVLSLLMVLATSLYGIIMGVKIHKIKKDIKNDKLNQLSEVKESYFDSFEF